MRLGRRMLLLASASASSSIEAGDVVFFKQRLKIAVAQIPEPYKNGQSCLFLCLFLLLLLFLVTSTVIVAAVTRAFLSMFIFSPYYGGKAFLWWVMKTQPLTATSSNTIVAPYRSQDIRCLFNVC